LLEDLFFSMYPMYVWNVALSWGQTWRVKIRWMRAAPWLDLVSWHTTSKISVLTYTPVSAEPLAQFLNTLYIYPLNKLNNDLFELQKERSKCGGYIVV